MGSCNVSAYERTDPTAQNYNAQATNDDVGYCVSCSTDFLQLQSTDDTKHKFEWDEVVTNVNGISIKFYIEIENAYEKL